MLRLIDEQLGRILLGLAVLVAVGAACLNPRQELPKVSEELHRRSVLVPLDNKSLTANSKEVFFMPDDGAQYAGPDRYILVKKIEVKQFSAVDLPLPPAAVMRSPQLLPEPGPALEGTQKLPRFGDEFPPVGVANAAPNQPVGLVPDPKTPPKPGPLAPVPDQKAPPRTGPAAPLDPRAPPKTGDAKTSAKAPGTPEGLSRTGDKNF